VFEHLGCGRGHGCLTSALLVTDMVASSRPTPTVWIRQSVKTIKSSCRRCSGSATRSIPVIFPPVIVKLNTTRGRLPGAHSPVHQRRLCEPGPPGEGARHSRRAADLLRCACVHGCSVGTEHDVRVQYGEQRVEITPREAARNAVTTSRWRLRSASGPGAAPCTRRRARLARQPPSGGCGVLRTALQARGHILWLSSVIAVTDGTLSM
jgi:hypothetical protein